MSRLINDDTGSAALYVSLIFSLAFLAVAFIFCTPAMDIMINLYNGFIGEGWVSEQSGQTMSLVKYAWMAIPVFGILAIPAGVIIRAYMLHEGGQ